jgi:hypothetical protein
MPAGAVSLSMITPAASCGIDRRQIVEQTASP